VLTITSAAANVIHEWLRASSGVSRPTVYLGQASNAPEDVRYLYPLVYPSSHFVWLTTTVHGFRFASRLFYPQPVRQALKDGVLDAGARGLVLKDAKGAVVLPANASPAL